MYFATFEYLGQEKSGVLSNDGQTVIALDQIITDHPPGSLADFIQQHTTEQLDAVKKATLTQTGVPLDEVKILAPIPQPSRGIICLGKNYVDHVKEIAGATGQSAEAPEEPVYFSKLVDRAAGDSEIIPNHQEITRSLDYEVELAVIIGKAGKDIPEELAADYIFGYTILNDITARDLQKKHLQWYKGKSLDGACPMGPFIVHQSMIPFPPALEIKCFVNGELRQNSNTSNLIHDVAKVISDFSRGITLKPGDIISTGTPSGVGMGFKPFKFLQPGDEIRCVIEKIGSLTNIISK